MEIVELQKQLEALAEEINKLKCANESCDKLTEAEEEAIEETEETVSEEAPEAEAEEEKIIEVEEPVEEAPAENSDYDGEIVKGLCENLLRTFMDSLNDITLMQDQIPEDDALNGVLSEIRENTNKIVGALQAVCGKDNPDAEVQEEAREDTEEVLAEPAIEEESHEDELEIIKPIEGEEEVKEEETEEVVEESVESSDKPAVNEDLKVFIGLTEFEPWGPAEDTFNYIEDEIGLDSMESILEELWPDGVDETTLNDLFAYDDNVYELFGVKDPYAEEEIEEVDDEEVEESLNESKSDEDIVKLRKEIKLGSLYTDDYENSFDIDPRDVRYFFDGYCDYLGELMEDDGISDNDYWDHIDEYDTDKNLIEWYYIADAPFAEIFEPEKFAESCNSDDIDEEVQTKGKCHRR